MSDLNALERQLHDLLGAAIGVGTSDPQMPPEPLFPQEDAVTQAMTEARLREFAAGRIAARRAMADLSLSPAAVAMGADRSPIWPDGLHGSIAHSKAACVAAVAQHGTCRALGIDIELRGALSADLWPTVLKSAEQDWAQSQPHPKEAALRIFCIKEACYKAQYPLTGRILDFMEMAVEVTTDSFVAECGSLGRITGGLGQTADHLIATAVIT